MHFDLTDLRLFLHVAEAASITQAPIAPILRWPPPVRASAAMEESVGIALLGASGAACGPPRPAWR